MSRFAALAVGLACLLTGPVGEADEQPEGNASEEVETGRLYDCGSLALYHLLRLEGVPAELPEIERRLPTLTPRGRSMDDLVRVANQFGLKLKGIRLSESAALPRRTCLAYLHQGEHGHFVIVRRVGHTGRLVQVLDGLAPPSVVEAADYRRSDSWTGLVLVRTDDLALSASKKLGLAALLTVPLICLASVGYRLVAPNRWKPPLARRDPAL